MTPARPRHALLASAAALALAGCLSPLESKRRVTLTLPTGEILTGTATTALSGQYYVRNERVSCYGSYSGRTVGGLSVDRFRKGPPVTATCSNGKTATSRTDLWEAGEAELLFAGGGQGRISLQGT